MASENTKKIVNDLTDYVNSFNMDSDGFCEAMSSEHRTLQQSFSRLCFKWLEHIAKDEYRTDPRNEGSKKMAQELLAAFKEKKIAEGWTDETLELMSKPSGYLSYI